jgi:signal transduction histidine kinase
VNLNTLSLYFYAGTVNLCLSALLLGLAKMRPGAPMLRGSAYAILVQSAGFAVFGFTDSLPRWATVIGANLLLLIGGLSFYSGVAAAGKQHKAKADWHGWAVLAMSAIAFWYWGLHNPNGTYRAIVFSVAGALIYARTTFVLSRAISADARHIPHMALAALFGAISVWMLVRAGVLWNSDPLPVGVRGANPTLWMTVFWYIVAISLTTACIVWIVLAQPRKALQPLVVNVQKKLHLLWALVLILCLACLGSGAVYFEQTYAQEHERGTRSAQTINDAFVQHTEQVISQVDTLLFAVRNFYLSNHSVANTEAFINSLLFDRAVIENVYLISERGEIVISHDPAFKGISVADRDYFVFLKPDGVENVFISSVEVGRVTHKFRFRIARRISNPDGSFAGIVLATVAPEAFSRYYEQLLSAGTQNTAVLLGTLDQKIRARSPDIGHELWQTPMESPLWDSLKSSPTGVYTNISMVDHIRRIYTYKKVGDWPLVMVNGFSQEDLHDGVYARLRYFGIGALVFFAIVFTLAGLLTVEIRRRIEQDRFLSMLSHELKTSLSTIAMTLGNPQIPENIKLRVGRSIGAMNAIVERCLQSDRLASGRVDVARALCDLAAIAHDIGANCSAPQQVTIESSPAVNAHTDAQLFSVILSNLIDNALKYGQPESAVRVNIAAAVRKGASGVVILVSNAPGVSGMPDPKMVFKKFYRAPGAHGNVGSGLGLHIAEGFARKLGGRLRYIATDDKVNFELWIPA